jgi:hypothetical protein
MRIARLVALALMVMAVGLWAGVSFGGETYILEQGSRLCDDTGRFCFDGYISRDNGRQVVIEVKGRVAKGCDPGRVTFLLVGGNPEGARFSKEISVDIKGDYGEIIDKKVGIGRGISATWRVEKVIYHPYER